MVELARQLRRPDPDRRPVSLRKIAAALAERGYLASTGKPYEAGAISPRCSANKRISGLANATTAPA